MIQIPGKIPIHIYPIFWLLVGLIGWLNTQSIMGTLIWGGVIVISVLIHEFGHALTAVAFGQKAEISLVGMGGLTTRRGEKLSKWKDFIIVLNGPLAGLCLAFLSYLLIGYLNEKMHPLLRYALMISLEVNIFWTILNLLPILPLDGGHLFRIVLEGLFGLNGAKWAFLISVILSGLLALYLLAAQQQIVLAALFLMLGFESYRSWTEMRKITPSDTNQDLQDLLKASIQDMNNGLSEKAMGKLYAIRDASKRGILFITSSLYLAHLLAQQGKVKMAWDLLSPLEKQLSVEGLQFLQQLASRQNMWKEAVRIGNLLYREAPSATTAIQNALANAMMGNVEPTIGWLRSAEEQGLSNLEEILKKSAFDPVRDSPEFQSWVMARKKSGG